MLVEELSLDNIKCFEKQTLRFLVNGEWAHWVTFLGENGGGKTTALQALALLLAGPEGAQKLLPRPLAWLRSEETPGSVSTRIRQGVSDPGQFGETKIPDAFAYSYYVTGSRHLSIRGRSYSEAAIVEKIGRRLSWLRQNAFASSGRGWFAVGYGAFRRLTRTSQIVVPVLETPARFTNFLTQFSEDESLSAFELWMVYLDYRKSKGNGRDEADRQMRMGVDAINRLLPEGAEFDSVTAEGRLLFRVKGVLVPSAGLSDGYRSVVALAGDLVWRLLQAFPESEHPLDEEGVVLIDELDIHLHPHWQRQIAGWLRKQFPNIQFIVATHSPFIAAGAGEGALTLRFGIEHGVSVVEPVPSVAAMNVDRALASEAFGLASPYSPETQTKIDRYDALAASLHRNPQEEQEFESLSRFMARSRPFGGPPRLGSLDDRTEKYLEGALR